MTSVLQDEHFNQSVSRSSRLLRTFSTLTNGPADCPINSSV